jgi:hypothetical protein
MSYVNPIWLEGQRRRWQRHDWQRFIRHDAHRFLTPAGIAEEKRAAEAEQAARHEAEAAAAAEHEAFYAEHLELRRQLADVKFELAFRRIFRKYSPDQPRVPAGSAEGGQWTGGGGGAGQDDGDVPQDGESLAQDLGSMRRPGPGQEPRRDLLDLDAIANHPPIRARIDEAWAASNPNGLAREHGFWISRSDATGELFTRPFANPGGLAAIVPGAPPSDAIAFFHTHPLRSEFGGGPSPSLEDSRFAARVGLPGLLQSHNGMYYFGPLLRPRRSP